jgi:SecD/SecF fusion protein
MMAIETKSGGRWWMGAAVIVSIVLMNSATGQDTKSDSKTDEKAVAAQSDEKAAPAPPATKEDEKTAAPAAGAKSESPPAVTSETPAAPGKEAEVSQSPASDSAPASTPPAGETKAESDSPPPTGAPADSPAQQSGDAAGTSAGNQAATDWGWLQTLLILVALFALPVIAGNYLAKVWRMPDHAWKISLTLFVVAGSLFVCVAASQHWRNMQFKFGPDLAGGSTLIYELQDEPVVADDPNRAPGAAVKDGSQQLRSGGREFTMSELIDSLKKRLDPDGTKEMTIRAYGPAVEIIIPQVGPEEMEFVKLKITKLGQLEFRITADPNISKDKPRIEAAKLLPPTKQEVRLGDQLVAKWVPYDEKEFGPADQPDGYVKRMAGDTPEILVLIDPFNVTGEYLTSATRGYDEHGMPAVHFAFNSAGAQRFERLTGQNTPNPATPDVYRHLGILLDGRLASAPVIRSKISDRGEISGGSMTERDVELTVQVLDAGSLPAALNKTPISQEIISPTLGGQTVEQGKRAIAASLIGVMVFMIAYYRFAGIVACLALTLNLLMVLSLMVLIKAAFTLPGLAGLALTVGMSVDANVLIYERIREELARGAALRMAIRNGFSRAMSAIIDSNLTTIISGIVLFYIGTDQVKGFAVTLVLGILTSMFSAIFFARLVFDVAERQGWIKQLRMMRILSKPNFDFLRYRWVMLVASWTLIAIGLVAAYMRGTQLFDIDFTGGSSVTFTLNDKDKTTLGAVRNALVETELADKNLLVVERGKTGTSFTVDTSEQSVDDVKTVIGKVFGEKLKKYSLEIGDLKAVSDANFTGTEASVRVNAGANYAGEEGMSHDALRDQIAAVLAQQGHPGARVTLTNPDYRSGSAVRFTDWKVRVAGLDEAATKTALESVQTTLHDKPLFPLANTIGGRVSSNMQFQALFATAISLVAMIIYLWLRFQKPAYGIAAGVALIHDVLMTIGMIALSYYIVEAVPAVAQALRIDSFQINLTIVAALLTIIGFSVNDTIVTFDRLREIKGKSPSLTANMVNESVNQTLSRTILTAFTVFIVVFVLYIYGGAGLHPFAFAFLVGVFVGMYSTIYIASPVLLWLSGVSTATQPQAPAASTPRGMQPAR